VVGKSYRLLEKIGAGTLGEVWRARHEKMGREVALKLIAPKWKISEAMTQAFLREARASGQLQVASVVPLLDSGVADGAAYVVMPLLHAEKLERFLKRRGALPVGIALRLASALGQGLAAAHDQNIWHRRIAPGNVLLHREPSGKVIPKLLDFGSACLVGDRSRSEIAGNVGCIAPEQAMGGDGDWRSDIWSLAVLLCHAVTGVAPFSSKTAVNLLEEMEGGIAAAVARAWEVDAAVGAVVRDTLVRDRTKRPRARAFTRRLQDLAKTIPGDLDLLGAVIEIPEALDPTLLQTIAPPRPPGPAPKSARLPSSPNLPSLERREPRRPVATESSDASSSEPRARSSGIPLEMSDSDLVSSVPPRV